MEVWCYEKDLADITALVGHTLAPDEQGRVHLWKEDTASWAQFRPEVRDLVEPAPESVKTRALRSYAGYAKSMEDEEGLEGRLASLARSVEVGWEEWDEDEARAAATTLEGLAQEAEEMASKLRRAEAEKQEWKENHDRMFRAWAAAKKEGPADSRSPRTAGEAHPSERWCLMRDPSGTRCTGDAVADGLCTKHWRQREAGTSHPADNWCRWRNKDGERCLWNAQADGLCTKHWRMRQDET